MRIVKSDEYVEAFHFLGQSLWQFPIWLLDALTTGAARYYTEGGPYIALTMKKGRASMLIAPGIWIIRYQDGELDGMTGEAFLEQYEVFEAVPGTTKSRFQQEIASDTSMMFVFDDMTHLGQLVINPDHIRHNCRNRMYINLNLDDLQNIIFAAIQVRMRLLEPRR